MDQWPSGLLIFTLVLACFTLHSFVVLGFQCISNLYKFLLMPAVRDLRAHYGGKGTWAVLTGASGGQARLLAKKLSAKGFNILLLGREHCHETAQECRDANPNVEVRVVACDFANALNEKDFFKQIEAEFEKIGTDLGLLLNCVGHRHAWTPYHEYPVSKMKDVIATGTIVQAYLSKLALQVFTKRALQKKKSLLFTLTAQGHHPLSFFAVGQCNPWISIPYMSVYEATNAWGFAHHNSLAEEYGMAAE